MSGRLGEGVGQGSPSAFYVCVWDVLPAGGRVARLGRNVLIPLQCPLAIDYEDASSAQPYPRRSRLFENKARRRVSALLLGIKNLEGQDVKPRGSQWVGSPLSLTASVVGGAASVGSVARREANKRRSRGDISMILALEIFLVADPILSRSNVSHSMHYRYVPCSLLCLTLPDLRSVFKPGTVGLVGSVKWTPSKD